MQRNIMLLCYSRQTWPDLKINKLKIKQTFLSRKNIPCTHYPLKQHFCLKAISGKFITLTMNTLSEKGQYF